MPANHSRSRAVSGLVFLTGLHPRPALAVQGDGEQVGPTADRAVLRVRLAPARTRVDEGVVLFAAERTRVGHHASAMPSTRLRPRVPAAVRTTARVPGRRTIQPRETSSAQRAAPRAPPRWGWRSVQSRQAVAKRRRSRRALSRSTRSDSNTRGPRDPRATSPGTAAGVARAPRATRALKSATPSRPARWS